METGVIPAPDPALRLIVLKQWPAPRSSAPRQGHHQAHGLHQPEPWLVVGMTTRTVPCGKTRRRLNNEAIVCLEAGLGAEVPPVEEELARIRALRESLGPYISDPVEIDAFKREGQP